MSGGKVSTWDLLAILLPYLRGHDYNVDTVHVIPYLLNCLTKENKNPFVVTPENDVSITADSQSPTG